MSEFHMLEKIKYSEGRVGVKVVFHLPAPATSNKAGKLIKDSFLDDKQSNKVSLASKLSNITPEDQVKLDAADMLEYEYTLMLKESDLELMDIADIKLKLKSKYSEILAKVYKSMEYRYDLWKYEDDLTVVIE